MSTQRRSGQQIPVDVSDHGGTFEISADLPGYEKQDIDVRVMTDRVQIVAEEKGDESGGRRRGDRRGRRSRIVTLPEPVEHEGASARYENGVLWMRLKKR